MSEWPNGCGITFRDSIWNLFLLYWSILCSENKEGCKLILVMLQKGFWPWAIISVSLGLSFLICQMHVLYRPVVLNSMENKDHLGSLLEWSLLGLNPTDADLPHVAISLLTSVCAHIGCPLFWCRTKSAPYAWCSLSSSSIFFSRKGLHKSPSNSHLPSFRPSTDSYTQLPNMSFYFFYLKTKQSLWLANHFFPFLYYQNTLAPDISPQTILILFFYLDENHIKSSN